MLPTKGEWGKESPERNNEKCPGSQSSSAAEAGAMDRPCKSPQNTQAVGKSLLSSAKAEADIMTQIYP